MSCTSKQEKTGAQQQQGQYSETLKNYCSFSALVRKNLKILGVHDTAKGCAPCGEGWGWDISDWRSRPDYLSLGYGEHIAHTHIRDLPTPFTDGSSPHRWCLSPEFASEFFPGELLSNQLISHIIPSLLSKAKAAGSNRRPAHKGQIMFITTEQ